MPEQITGEDVKKLFDANGIEYDEACVDFEVYVLEAIAFWNKETGYNPFLAAEFASPDDYPTYTYDPPGPNLKGNSRGGGRLLFLGRGFIAVTEVRTGITPDDTEGTLRTVGTDYRLKPYNAVNDSVPYTSIEFTYPVSGQPASVSVKGRPGYCSELPDDVWSALRNLAAAAAAEAIREELSQSPIEWSEDDVKERGTVELVQKFGTSWKAAGMRTLHRYVLMAR